MDSPAFGQTDSQSVDAAGPGGSHPARLAGTVVVESSGDAGELAGQLDSVLNARASERAEAVVICAEDARPAVAELLSARFPAARLVSLAAGDARDHLRLVLRAVKTGKVAFLARGMTYSAPPFGELPDDMRTWLAWLPPTSTPEHDERKYQLPLKGWLTTAAALEKLRSLRFPSDWHLPRLIERVCRDDPAALWASPAAAGVAPPPPRRGTASIGPRSTVLALVPHYRCEEWLEHCLASLTTQDRPPDGIVVIDDGSVTPPAAIVGRFPRVTLLASAETVGPYRLKQEVINNTLYDAYLFQDADDWSSRDRLARLLAEAERTGAELIGSQELRLYCEPGEMLPVCYPLDVNAAFAAGPCNPLLHPTSMVTRELVQRLGGFATGMRFGGDEEFLRRAAHVARIVNVRRYCYFRRRRADSLTGAPDTGIRSPARRAVIDALRERAAANEARAGRGEPPDLSPWKTAGPVRLAHLLGPPLLTG